MSRRPKPMKPNPSQSSFGIWLTTHMSINSIMMIDITRELGTSYDTVYGWISGKNYPRLDTLIMICEVLSKYNGQSPLDMFSAAISTFDEMVYAMRRYHHRHPSKRFDKGHEEMLDAYNLINDPRIWPKDDTIIDDEVNTIETITVEASGLV